LKTFHPYSRKQRLVKMLRKVTAGGMPEVIKPAKFSAEKEITAPNKEKTRQKRTFIFHTARITLEQDIGLSIL